LVANAFVILGGSLIIHFGRGGYSSAIFREAQFGNESQVISPPPSVQGPFTPESHAVQDIHFTPGNPLTLRLATALRF